jgi:hypothetical protein
MDNWFSIMLRIATFLGVCFKDFFIRHFNVFAFCHSFCVPDASNGRVSGVCAAEGPIEFSGGRTGLIGGRDGVEGEEGDRQKAKNELEVMQA